MFSRCSPSYFDGKIVLITGAGSGLGRETARQLASRGAEIYITDINLDSVQVLSTEIDEKDGVSHAMTLDVTSRTDFDKVMEQIMEDKGKIDLLINNAGVSMGGEFHEIAIDDWDRINSINFGGVLYGTKLAYDIMVDQGYGQIVNISSLYGQVPSPMVTPYATTKTAVFSLSRSLRWEAQHYNVKINVVCPGYMATNFIDSGKYANITAEDAISVLPFSPISAEKAAKIVITGICKDKAVITFPWYVRPYWWLYRWFPGLMGLIYGMLMKDFREKKIHPE